ncbi:MAG TPA: sugar transferase [Pirellulales bacterium]|nr:sugar transferase [Pirellulales bacterium]
MSQGAAAAAVLESSAGHSPSGFHAGTFVERRKAPRGFAAAAAWAPTVLDLPLNPLQLAPADRRPALAWPVVAAAGNLGVVYQTLKRAFDIAGSLALLVAFSPLMLVALVALCITTKGKPIFSQDRVGLCGRRFRMFKFRTMVLDAAKLQHLVKNEQNGPVFKNRRDPRITRIGRLLRSTSIDEMPQLVNVLLGQMSLVGPRPPVPAEVARYTARQLRRLSVKPGLTCLWQVSGRCEIGFDRWVRMDLWYVRHQGLWTDLKLLVKTPLSVLSRRGAY